MLCCSATGADSRELYGTGALNRELYMVMGYRGSLSGVFLVTGYRACRAFRFNLENLQNSTGTVPSHSTPITGTSTKDPKP